MAKKGPMIEGALCPYCFTPIEDCECAKDDNGDDEDYGHDFDIPDGDGFEA